MHSTFRGGGRPWRGSSSSQPSQGPIKTPPAPPLGSLLEHLTPEELESDDQDAFKRVAINDVKFLASFNWLESEVPTIVFPGKPEGGASGQASSTDISIRHASHLGSSARIEETAKRQRQVLPRPKRGKTSNSPNGARCQSGSRPGPRPKNRSV